MSDIDVSPGAIRKHADEVDRFMDAINEAVSSGTSLDDLRAFGIIGEPWAQLLGVWTSSATTLVTTAAEAGRSLARSLRNNADDYEKSDQTHAQNFDQINSALTGGAR